MVRVFLVLFLLLTACNARPEKKSEFDVQQAATTWRYEKPEGVITPDKLVSSLRIELVNSFPVWREDIDAGVDVSIKNVTKSHLPARTKVQLFIYSYEQKQPLYWSNIDLAYGESTGPANMSILSLPVNASKDLRIHIASTTWGGVRSQIWPDSPFYAFIPSGKYLMRLELDLYDDNDALVGTAVSNFVEFTSVMKAEKLNP